MENIVQPQDMKPVNDKKSAFDSNKLKKILVTLLPLIALVVLFALFCVTVLANGFKLNIYIKNIINRGTVLAIVATGAVFIYTLGSFDISLGAATLLSATLGVLTYNSTQNTVLTVLVIISVGVGCSLLSSTLASLFRIPVFVTTVAMMSVLTAIATQIINVNGNGESISIPSTVFGSLDQWWVKIIFIVLWLVLCVFIFDFLMVGRRQKFLGANPFCAKLTGISLNKYAIIAFAMAGLGVGIGAILTLSYTPSVSTGTASSIGMDILVAIVFGGMPISGGPRSKIYSAVVGGFSYVLLNTTLSIILRTAGVAGHGSDGISQIISAIFFLAVVYVASINYRAKNLPR